MSKSRKTLSLDGEVYEALANHCIQSGGKVSGFAALAITQWLKERGVEVEYPRPRQTRSAATAPRRRATDRTPTPPTAA